jgi:pimeloyl-ACP methyl ester carboxylesterase
VTAIRQASIDRVRGGDFDGQVETVVPLLIGPTARARPDLVAAVRTMVTAVGPDRYVRQIQALMRRPDQRALPAGIACPTLVLAGRDDPVATVEAHRALAAAIPTARLAVVEQAGHLVTLDQPVAVTALLRDWLTYAG